MDPTRPVSSLLPVMTSVEEVGPVVEEVALPVADEGAAHATRERVLHEESVQRVRIETQIDPAPAIDAATQKLMGNVIKQMQQDLLQIGNNNAIQVKQRLEQELKKFEEEASQEERVVIEFINKSLLALMKQPTFIDLYTVMQRFLGFSDLSGMAKAYLSSSTKEYTKELKTISQENVDNICKVLADEKGAEMISLTASCLSLIMTGNYSKERLEILLEALEAEEVVAALKEKEFPEELTLELQKICTSPKFSKENLDAIKTEIKKLIK